METIFQLKRAIILLINATFFTASPRTFLKLNKNVSKLANRVEKKKGPGFQQCIT